MTAGSVAFQDTRGVPGGSDDVTRPDWEMLRFRIAGCSSR
jgi:hypothetical protein